MTEGYFGGALSRRLMIIGWSEREFARRLGASQAQVSRIAHSRDGRLRLTAQESIVLDRIAEFIAENPFPRRSTPSFLVEDNDRG